MLNREEVLFAIGFDGMNAVVDGASCRKYKGKTSRQLADAGMFRAAAAAALYDRNDGDLAYAASVYNAAAGSAYKPEQLQRVFGISLAGNITKAVLL